MPVRKYRITTTNMQDILVEVGSEQRGNRFLNIEELRYDADEQEKYWYYKMLKPALVIAVNTRKGIQNVCICNNKES